MSNAVLDVEISVEAGNWPDGLTPLAEKALLTTLEHCGYAIDGPCEVSVLFTDDAAQRILNKTWRSKDASTNVLSFPQIDFDDPIEGLLGDISLAYETLVREAQELDKTFEAHFVHLLVHGMLHILGYDHLTSEEALDMETKETNIMGLLGYSDPYDGQELVE